MFVDREVYSVEMESFTSLFVPTEAPAGGGGSAVPGLGFCQGKSTNAMFTAEEGVPRKTLSGTALHEPFYLLRELPANTELTGSTNLITYYNLEHTFNKFCGKKVKEKLSNFLPDLPGMIDMPGTHDNSSLRSLIEKPPICGNSFNPLTGNMLTGFRLHAGPLPEQYRLMHIQPPKKKSKHKHKQNRTQDPVPPGPELSEKDKDKEKDKDRRREKENDEEKEKDKSKEKEKLQESSDKPSSATRPLKTTSDYEHKKKKKKKDDDPERKKKKKEKKKKKNRHSPDHPGIGVSQPGGSLR